MSDIDISSVRLVPTAGTDGWLCRFPDMVLWLPSDEQASQFISASRAAGSSAELLQQIGSHLTDPQAEPWPPFALLAARGPDLVVVVHGPLQVVLEHTGGPTVLYGGDDAGSWLHRLVRDVSAVRAGSAGNDLNPAELDRGIVRAAGFALVLQAGSSQPARASRQSRGTQRTVPAATTVPEQEPTAGQPSPADQPPEADQPPGADSGAAGQPTADEPRDIVGTLRWDTGEVYELSGPVLIGRDPTVDAAVPQELAALVPQGKTDSMSLAHAELRPQDDGVLVTDRSSTNGTFIWDETDKVWQRLTAGETIKLQTEAIFAFGERTATYRAGPAQQ
jgi:hypothetical protein